MCRSCRTGILELQLLQEDGQNRFDIVVNFEILTLNNGTVATRYQSLTFPVEVFQQESHHQSYSRHGIRRRRSGRRHPILPGFEGRRELCSRRHETTAAITRSTSSSRTIPVWTSAPYGSAPRSNARKASKEFVLVNLNTGAIPQMGSRLPCWPATTPAAKAAIAKEFRPDGSLRSEHPCRRTSSTAT